jgi:hypothetical protein
MNIDNVGVVLDHLVKLRDSGMESRFNMRTYADADGKQFECIQDMEYFDLGRVNPDPTVDCGSTLCIAGWTQLLLAKTRHDRAEHAEDFARRVLGLSWGEAVFWFCGQWTYKPLVDITLDDAIGFLDARIRCATHPDWTGAFRPSTQGIGNG